MFDASVADATRSSADNVAGSLTVRDVSPKVSLREGSNESLLIVGGGVPSLNDAERERSVPLRESTLGGGPADLVIGGGVRDNELALTGVPYGALLSAEAVAASCTGALPTSAVGVVSARTTPGRTWAG